MDTSTLTLEGDNDNTNHIFDRNDKKQKNSSETATIFNTKSNFNFITKVESEIKDNSETNRIPKLEDLEKGGLRTNSCKNQNPKIDKTQNILERPSIIRFGKSYPMKPSYVQYTHFGQRGLPRRHRKEFRFYNYCLVSVCSSFILGLVIGIVLMGSTQTRIYHPNIPKRYKDDRILTTRTLNSLKVDANIETEIFNGKNEKDQNRFRAVSFTDGLRKHQQTLDKNDVYPKGLTDDMKDILKDNKMANRKLDKHAIISLQSSKKIEMFVPNDRTVLYENIFWGPQVENSMPQGYGPNTADVWERYLNHTEVTKMENGCGRMQNRLVTFKDGIQACVRYRQNTDQIQGEIFSFYVSKLLNLTNVAPSVVKAVDVKDDLWKDVAADIAAAQWSSNRAVVLTQYIPSLESAKIPDVFKPSNRHLNKNDVLEISTKENGDNENSKKILIEKLKVKNVKVKKDNASKPFDHIDMKLNKKTIDLFVELAQWSDLIIFDYLTANLDRIVNNLFNFQWNINIMDGPAHNLARKMDSGLLLFLDNESGLLHGYRLLKKYNVYHSLMLDNLCVFRRTTVEALKTLHKESVGAKLSEMFHRKNNAVIRDILPPLPEKNAKILHERIGKVLGQIEKCQQKFSNR